MVQTIDTNRAAQARAIFAAALKGDKLSYVSPEEFDATAATLEAKSDAAIARRAHSAGTGVFPNAFEQTTSTKYADRVAPRAALEGEWTEGVEEIEPEPFDASDPRWSRKYKAPKPSFAHLPIGGFTDGQIHKLTPEERKYLQAHPIVLDRSRTLPAPTLSAKDYERTAMDKTNARRKSILQNEWLSMQRTADATQRTFNYRTLSAAQVAEFGFQVKE